MKLVALRYLYACGAIVSICPLDFMWLFLGSTNALFTSGERLYVIILGSTNALFTSGERFQFVVWTPFWIRICYELQCTTYMYISSTSRRLIIWGVKYGWIYFRYCLHLRLCLWVLCMEPLILCSMEREGTIVRWPDIFDALKFVHNVKTSAARNWDDLSFQYWFHLLSWRAPFQLR